MSSVPEIKLVSEKTRTIGKTGNTMAVYIPREVKKYVSIGDKIVLDASIDGKYLKLVIRKRLVQFRSCRH